MKAILIRHARVLFKWKGRYSSAEFDRACEAYDSGDIEISEKMGYPPPGKLYVSSLRRSKLTAAMLFPGFAPIEREGLVEVPVRAFYKTAKRLPTLVWFIVGRAQWKRNRGSQIEYRRDTIARLEGFLIEIEAEGEDCVVVGHGFALRVMMKLMRKRGWKAPVRLTLANLERVECHIRG